MNCSRKFSDRYKPAPCERVLPDTVPQPTRVQIAFTVCVETVMVIALVVITVLVALVIAAPM